MIDKILVPTAFSEPCDRALDVALELAAKLGASLHIVHAVPEVSYMGSPLSPGSALAKEFRAVADEKFTEYTEKLRARGVTAPCTLVHGAPHTQILRCAAEVGAKLVVIGTNRRTGVEHFILGSVAERVVRSSPIPVLVVPPVPPAPPARPAGG